MTTSNESTSSSMDGLKWCTVALLLIGAVVGNYFAGEADAHFLARLVGVIFLVVAALGVAAVTTKGKIFISFAKEAQIEVRKVVWPTRQEAMQTTFIVLAVSAITALILWGLDGILVRLVAFITGVSL
ncbi:MULTISPECIES: preprotein translocase subunit SecE [unclassified Motilimonas]|uniref:preprotein translocase subunit SecE n=1 Tax=Motilimonas TaxID=1914248 RepID=UPI001E29BF16|nr:MULTISPECIES: preprotein translocase subunit SecE [unclassified Motilimonas]MCE0556513.1 preprotein translocase subunit SecE [Motilimonas sp. E26]MDO6527974.1 preprotein translocase subunit SecE [Motilimonas sp. 1_MG-2023]